MSRLLFCVLLLAGLPAFAHPDLSPFHQLFQSNQLYAGFGLSRDLISHAYKGRAFAPRDYDFAVIGTGWTEAEAIERLARVGRIRRTLTIHRELLQPSGQVWSSPHGFVVIVDYQGQQLDFKFFPDLEAAHFRGFFNVEKVLLPLNGRSVDDLRADFVGLAESGRLPPPEQASDPYEGIRSILDGTPRTVNWGKTRAYPLEWLLRGAMIHAKLESPGLPKEEARLMRQALQDARYVWHTDHALIDRAIRHRQWWKVRDLLAEVGFFERFQKLRWHEGSGKKIRRWLQETQEHPSCQRVFL